MFDLNPVPVRPAEPITFGIIGWGWRSKQFADIAARLPDWFRVTGLLRRKADGTEPVPVVTSLDALLAAKPSFVLSSVPRAHTPEFVLELCRRGIPVLTETPPATDPALMRAMWAALPAGARVQVAEQYPFQPYHQAVQTLLLSGRFGEVTHANVSIAHGYHGMALLRYFLGVGLTPVRLRALAPVAPLVAGPGRDGPPAVEEKKDFKQMIALLDFGGGRSGVFDFISEQYFSWIRSSRLLVRGTRGEINETTARWLVDFRTPARQELTRWDGGTRTNLEGIAHQGYTLGGEWIYRNPFGNAPLPDDYIAMATVLWRMAHYLETGRPFYGLAEACHDHQLGLFATEEAARTGAEVVIQGEPWTKA